MLDLAALVGEAGLAPHVFMAWGQLGDAAFGHPSTSDGIASSSPYRHLLTRVAGGLAGRGVCGFVMLNPSVADHDQNDNTIRRTIGYATAWGYADLIIGNAFAFRSTSPKPLRGMLASAAIGAYNDLAIAAIARVCDLVVCGWGNHGATHGRGDQVLRILRDNGATPHALRITGAQQPEHPLYLPKALRPVPL